MGLGGNGLSDPVADYIAGAVAGSANIFSGYPFDTVKVRLQSQTCHYNGPWRCFTSIVRSEGPRGLFRGLSSPLVGGAIETGINYAVYQRSLQALQDMPDIVAIPASGAIAGFFLSFVVSPAELIKCRMQLGSQDPAHRYTGPVDCFRQLVKEEGYFKGLTRGLGSTLAREMPGNAIYFSSYVALREIFPGKMEDISDTEKTLTDRLSDAASAVACGGLAGIAMWSAVLPLDNAKTKKQTAAPGSKHDVGLIRQLQLIHKQGGVKTFYAGLVPTLIRAFPANAAQWLTWELCIQHLKKPQ